jgi:hypothetical protein
MGNEESINPGQTVLRCPMAPAWSNAATLRRANNSERKPSSMNRAIMKMNQGYRSVCRLDLDVDTSIQLFGLADVEWQVHDMIDVVSSPVSGADLYATGASTLGVEADPVKRQIHRDVLRPVLAMEHLDGGTPASLIMI